MKVFAIIDGSAQNRNEPTIMTVRIGVLNDERGEERVERHRTGSRTPLVAAFTAYMKL